MKTFMFLVVFTLLLAVMTNSAPRVQTFEMRDSNLYETLNFICKSTNSACTIDTAAETIPVDRIILHNIEEDKLLRTVANLYQYKVVRAVDRSYLIVPRYNGT